MGSLSQMTLLYTGPCFLDHDTGLHPECAQRLHRVNAHLLETGLAGQCQQPDVCTVSRPESDLFGL